MGGEDGLTGDSIFGGVPDGKRVNLHLRQAQGVPGDSKGEVSSRMNSNPSSIASRAPISYQIISSNISVGGYCSPGGGDEYRIDNTGNMDALCA